MFWLIVISGSICFLFCWLLVSPVELEIDTVSAKAEFRWLSVGAIRVWYEDEWWLSMRVFFFRKIIPFSKIKKEPKKVTTASVNGRQKRKLKTKWILKKIIHVTSTLQVTEWQLAVDTGEYAWNARLYPLNFLLYTFGHLHINFRGENFLVVKIKGRPLKILYAFLR